MTQVPKFLGRRKNDATIRIPVVLCGGGVAPAGHAALGPGGDGEDFSRRRDPRTNPSRVSAGLEFAALVDARRESRGCTRGGNARSALCLQHGDAASGDAKLPTRSASVSAQNADRLGGFAGERV